MFHEFLAANLKRKIILKKIEKNFKTLLKPKVSRAYDNLIIAVNA